MTIDLVFITYNRLNYTKLALDSILADSNEVMTIDRASGVSLLPYEVKWLAAV